MTDAKATSTNDPQSSSSGSNASSAGPATLHGAAIRHLRALGHPLQPVLHVGKEGITDALVSAANAAILKHELIKVKVLSEAPVEREVAANDLASRTESVMAQVLGRTFLLYKKHPQKPKITLPKKPPPGAPS